MSDPTTIEQNIEQAIEALCTTAVNAGAFVFPVNYVTTVYDAGLDPDRIVTYPCVVITCAPFNSDTPGSILGYCAVTLSCMTDQNDDKFGSDINQMAQVVYPTMAEASVGPLVNTPWLLCGIDDTGPTEVNVDEETNTNIRSREYRIALAKVS